MRSKGQGRIDLAGDLAQRFQLSGFGRTSCTSVKFLVEGVGGPSCWSRDHPLSSKVLGHSFPGSSGGKEFTCNAGDPTLIPRLGRSPEKRDRLPTPVFLGFPGGSEGKESARSVRDLGSIPGLGRSPGEGHQNPYSCLENSMDRGTWWATVHGVTQSQAQLSN